MKLAAAAVALILTVSGAAQERPSGSCTPSGPPRPPAIAEVATPHPATTWLACGSPKGCATLPASPGAPVLINYQQGDFTCGYFQSRQGAGDAWIRTTDLRLLPVNPNPALRDWLGIWSGGEDQITIGLAATPGALQLAGHAKWHGTADVIHYGRLKGPATPTGNHLHFVEGDDTSCIIDLTLLGPYIFARDNQRCGGMNVRFQGFWKRTGTPPAKK